MKKGFLRFYLIYQEPLLVSQSFFVFSFHTRKLLTLFYKRIKKQYFVNLSEKKETLGLLNKKLHKIKEQRNHHSLLKIFSNKKEGWLLDYLLIWV